MKFSFLTLTLFYSSFSFIYKPIHHNIFKLFYKKNYPLSAKYYEELIKRLNSKNITLFDQTILNNDNLNITNPPKIKIIINKKNILDALTGNNFENDNNNDNDDNYDNDDDFYKQNYKTKNFEVIKKNNFNFNQIGGYQNIKEELKQCIDILKNYQKYTQYNVRIPKGLILEGPPGTGKTLIAKALAGEAKCSFIPVSGSDFQEKYVGIGAKRIKELFQLAKKNIPCIIFIDEIDALCRKRSSDGEISSSEKDNTLNALLVELDGFKNNTGIFLVAATNRIDLLDNAFIRPGRIDKKIFIGLPDSLTREAIINIHIQGKPHDDTIILNDLIDFTEGLSGAQIENLLNEAMLNALRSNKTYFSFYDVDFIINKMMAGWQPIEHEFTNDIIDHIAIHEMGHAIVGLLSKHHSKMSKVVINLSSPKSPGYTVFKSSTTNIYIRESLFEHLMILLAGRVAEEVFYNVSVTNGAINDFQEALKLAEKMVLYYGMGTQIIYPSSSEKYKELIDNDVIRLINDAYKCSELIIQNSKELIFETSEILKKEKILQSDTIKKIIDSKYKNIMQFTIDLE
jgi:cell division protease FtsH